MFVTIETIENGERKCMAVPQSWVNNGVLMYPRKTEELFIARRKLIPPKKSWMQMPCKILRENIREYINLIYYI